MKFALFITSGIGNALYLVPLIKHLRSQGTVTCISTSPFRSEEVFDGFEDALFDQIICIDNSAAYLKLLPKMLSKFDGIYLDYFAATRRHLVLAHLMGKTVHTNNIPKALAGFFRARLQLTMPKVGIHEGTQYLRFAQPDATDADLTEAQFALKPKAIRSLGYSRYITLQPGAGNNKTPWKTWPERSWMSLMQGLISEYTDLHLIVLGDSTEVHMNRVFAGISNRVIAIAGQTQLKELPSLISEAELHIGGDSAMLHIAGCVGTPTVTVCGGSDPEIFGWHKINAEKHVLVKHTISCHPCYRWILPNRSRVDDPATCPDFKCIRSIDPEQVLTSVRAQLKREHAS